MTYDMILSYKITTLTMVESKLRKLHYILNMFLLPTNVSSHLQFNWYVLFNHYFYSTLKVLILVGTITKTNFLEL